MFSPSSLLSTTTNNRRQNRIIYPYSRSEEYCWQPEEVARHLSALVATTTNSSNLQHLLHHGWSSRHIPLLRRKYGSNVLHNDEDDEDYYDDNDDNVHEDVNTVENDQIRSRNLNNYRPPRPKSFRKRCKLFCKHSLPCLPPIMSPLVGQLKEPLILMLLLSAGLSILLMNWANDWPFSVVPRL